MQVTRAGWSASLSFRSTNATPSPPHSAPVILAGGPGSSSGDERKVAAACCSAIEGTGLRAPARVVSRGEQTVREVRVPPPHAAAEVLTGLARNPGNPWVLPGKKKGTRLRNINNKIQTKACSQSLPRYVIENSYLSVSGPPSTDGASIVRQEPWGSRAPLSG